MPKQTSVQNLLQWQNSRNSANEKFIAEAGVTQEETLRKMINRILNMSCMERDVGTIWNTDHISLLFADDIEVVLQLYIQIIQTQKTH